MATKDSLKPKDNPRVIDLVAAAGVDVTPWSHSKKGPVRVPASNPAYCYEWTFVEPGKLVVLSLWYDELLEDAISISYELNPKRWSKKLSSVDGITSSQRSAGSKRAARIEEAIAYAYANGLPVRAIIGDGERRNLSDPKSRAASRMQLRLLDPEPWRVASYDSKSGDVKLVRGGAPRFADQFSTEVAALRKQKEVTGNVWERDRRVRDAVLRRAKGFCELCGKAGFRTSAGETYLETHHVVSLSDRGEDSTRNVVALCPNDHREAHYSERRQDIRNALSQVLTAAKGGGERG
jgi:5-methylcytosine-specific restriction protein A